jgi:hypothetical protein
MEYDFIFSPIRVSTSPNQPKRMAVAPPRPETGFSDYFSRAGDF